MGRQNRAFIAGVLVLTVFIGGTLSYCNFPPSLWCSSPEISSLCQVYDHCQKYLWPVDEAPRVNLTLYLESLCPDCQRFFREQLNGTFYAVGSIMNLEIVPYGNAEEHYSHFKRKWIFECQHGEDECLGNMIETCSIHLLKDINVYFPFIACMEFSSELPNESSQSCAKQLGIDLPQIMTCVNGSLGNQLEHQMALKTDALDPPHQYVPWITLNGVHTEDMEKQAESNLLKLICDTFQGTKPAACAQEMERCMKASHSAFIIT